MGGIDQEYFDIRGYSTNTLLTPRLWTSVHITDIT